MLCFSNLNLLSLFLIVASFGSIKCECRESFMTLCDTMHDFVKYNNTENASEVMIGSEHGPANMTSVHFMRALNLGKYYHLKTLMIIRAVNNLEKDYAYQCTYYTSPLKTWILYGNVLKTIEPYHFPLVNLKKMSLVNNNIESIKPWGFRSHPIEELDLSDNFLEVIESESLPLNEKSKVVTIKNNKITHIEPGCFAEGLERLNLDYNKLRYIQDDIFNNLGKLKELTLSHNRLNVLPNIDHLKSLVIFDISNNAITTLKKGTFANMDELKFLDFSNNQISSELIMEWLNTPRKQPTLIISLAMNRLRGITLDNVDLQNQTLVLYGNPWDCHYWPRLQSNLSGHESECDKKFISSGNVPYCINIRELGHPFVSQEEDDINRFHDSVRSSEKKAGCILAPNKNEWLFPQSFGCVA